MPQSAALSERAFMEVSRRNRHACSPLHQVFRTDPPACRAHTQQRPGKSSLNTSMRHAPQTSLPKGSQRVGQITRIVFLDVVARALDVNPPPVGEARGEVMGSVLGND